MPNRREWETKGVICNLQNCQTPEAQRSVVEKILSDAGLEGWKLVTSLTTIDPKQPLLVFKRPKV